VLVADSYKDAADSLSLLIKLWGYDCRVAYSGPDAVQMASLYHPDVVLSDLVLNGFDGCSLARRLAGNANLIAVTGLGDRLHRHQAAEAGFQFLLLKPASPAQMQTLLRSFESCGHEDVLAECVQQLNS
jgi:CheY-like chemotaxis protein